MQAIPCYKYTIVSTGKSNDVNDNTYNSNKTTDETAAAADVELLASVADAGAIANIKHSADTRVKSPEKLRTVPSYEGQEI